MLALKKLLIFLVELVLYTLHLKVVLCTQVVKVALGRHVIGHEFQHRRIAEVAETE